LTSIWHDARDPIQGGGSATCERKHAEFKQISAQGTSDPSLATLQTDAMVQQNLKALKISLGYPILLGISDNLADPTQTLLEPSTTPKDSRPLLIPDFVSSLPVVLEEDQETVLGVSGGTQIVLRTSHEKKPKLTSITFPQWAAANFRILHTLIKKGTLSTMTDVMN